MRHNLQLPRSKRLMEEISNTRFERILSNASQIAIIVMGGVVTLVALYVGQVILAPVFLAIVVGLMFGPVADGLDRRGVPQGLSAGVVVLLFLMLIAGSAILFIAPLSDWVGRIPVMWAALQAELANWREPIASVTALQEQIKGVLGGGNSMTVTVEEGASVLDIAALAPAILAQVLIFLASLYFFMATRDQIRIATLSLCVTRRMRWRMAHVFRDVEQKVSKFLLTISFINIGMGVAVAILMALIGMPTPILWGALAAVLNFIPFVGQALMVLILFAVGLGTQSGLEGALVPVGLYLALNFFEGNFVTPNLLGRTMTMNPFLIFLSITFWLWAWGPVGGFIAVPSLLILYSIATHILPIGNLVPRRATNAAAQAAATLPEPAAPLPPKPAKAATRKASRATSIP